MNNKLIIRAPSYFPDKVIVMLYGRLQERTYSPPRLLNVANQNKFIKLRENVVKINNAFPISGSIASVALDALDSICSAGAVDDLAYYVMSITLFWISSKFIEDEELPGKKLARMSRIRFNDLERYEAQMLDHLRWSLPRNGMEVINVVDNITPEQRKLAFFLYELMQVNMIEYGTTPETRAALAIYMAGVVLGEQIKTYDLDVRSDSKRLCRVELSQQRTIELYGEIYKAYKRCHEVVKKYYGEGAYVLPKTRDLFV